MIGNKAVWRSVGTAVALAALCLSAAGCIEELHQGGKVSFTASTSYLNGGVKGETKTLYSGEIIGNSSERINWVTGDLIKIRCAQASDPKEAVYKVTAGSNPQGAANDKAQKIEATPPDTELYWNMSGGKHHFFAAYPSSVTFNTTDYPGETDLLVMEHSVPAVQVVTQKQTGTSGTEYVPNMGLVAMGAYSGKDPGTSNPTVDLTFMPLVTSLRVELLAGDELSKNNKLTMLQLKSSSDHSTYPLAGSYTVAVGDYNNHKTDVFADGTDVYGSTGFKPFGFSPAPAATENVVRIVPDGTVFPQAGIQLDATAPTAFTFVMLPVAEMHLTLQLTFGGTYDATTQTVTGGTTRSLELKATQLGITDWWSPPALRKSYLRQVGVKKKTFKVARLSVTGEPQDWTESTGTAVSYADALVAPKQFNSIFSNFNFRVFSENLGGFEAEVTTTSGDTYTGSTTDLALEPLTATGYNSETDRGLSLHFRTSSSGSNGTTLGIPSGTFTPKAFTVSASGKKVYFSPGNLRYLASTQKWEFAPAQHDYIGIAPGNTTIAGRETQAAWIDLFRWATSGWDGGTAYPRTAYQPHEINNELDAYWPNRTYDLSLVGANAHGDWGVHNSPIAGENWRLLTYAEMEYLFNRPNSFLLAALPSSYPEFTVSFKAKDDPGYKVSYTVRKPMVCGVILFPDGFDTNEIDADIRGSIGMKTGINHAVVKNWDKLEDLGCVFLPEGRAMRHATQGIIGGGPDDGFYFTSTASSGHYVGALTFGGAYQGGTTTATYLSVSSTTLSEVTYGSRVPIAGSVRLVREVGWPGGTNPYNPGGGNGGDADFTYTVLPESPTIWTGESFTLSASSTATPAPTYTFSVDNTVVGPSSGSLTLAGTTASTTVTANTTPGKAVVTVKAKRGSIEKTDKTCTVTVYKLKDMTITNATENAGSPSGTTREYTLATPIAVGEACTLTPRVTYEDGTGSDKPWTRGTVVWKIADGQPMDVVTVAGGVVTARKAGTTIVEGTITKGSETRTVRCTVTVNPVTSGTEGYGKGNTTGF